VIISEIKSCFVKNKKEITTTGVGVIQTLAVKNKFNINKMKKIFTLILFCIISFCGFTQDITIYEEIKIDKIVISPDSRYIAIASQYDEFIKIYDIKSGQLIKAIQNVYSFQNMAFSSDSKYIFINGVLANNLLQEWLVDYHYKYRLIRFEITSENYKSIKKMREKEVLDVSQDGKYLVLNNTIFDAKTFKKIKEFEVNTEKLKTCRFSPDSKNILFSNEKMTYIYDINTAICIRSFSNNCENNFLLNFTNQYVRFYEICNRIAYPKFYNINSGSLKDFDVFRDNQSNCSLKIYYNSSLSSDNSMIAIKTSDTIRIYDLTKNELISEFETEMFTFRFSPDNKYFIGLSDKFISFWDINSLKSDKKDVVDVLTNVDINIPNNTVKNKYKFALVIGNEDYNTYQLGLTDQSNVDFAVNDATTFKSYLTSCCGFMSENVIFLTNAKAMDMNKALEKISLLTKNSLGNAEIIFYYAGHGLPDETTKEPFIIPVDVSGTELNYAINLNDIYAKLTEYPSKRVTVFLDACFTGGARNQGLVSARSGIRIKPITNELESNLVVFSATSEEQTALPYKDTKHGLFTYYLLLKLQQTEGNVSYSDLSDYIIEEVSLKSILINSKEQNPQVNVSSSLGDSWKYWKINE